MKNYPFKVSDIRSERLALPFYFLSDNHLSTKKGIEQRKRIEDMLILLDKIRQSKGTLFILGDFFDFWFDKCGYVPPQLKAVVQALENIINEGIEIHYLGGNHDYWIEGYLTQNIGVRFYPDALRFTWDGKNIYCQHGDHVVYNGKHYPWMREVLRGSLSINLLKILPIKWTYKLGEHVSHYNQNVQELPQTSGMLVKKMHDHLREQWKNKFDISLSGHIHYPYMERSADGKIIAVLGDWIVHRSYGYMDAKGFRLINK